MPPITKSLYSRIKSGEIKVNYGGRKPSPLEHGFWDQVDKNGPLVRSELGRCWQWIGSFFGAKHGERYGCINPGKQRGGKNISAHRCSWMLHNGDIPDGLGVLHKCDNPSCINPNHLFLGTHQENINDAVAKNRMASGDRSGYRKYPERYPKGEQCVRAKLTEKQVIAILNEYVAQSRKHGAKVLARKYTVSYCTIMWIVKGRIWKHVYLRWLEANRKDRGS